MITKPQNVLRLLLLLPYLAWGGALLFTALIAVSPENLPPINVFFDILAGVVSFYTIGILVWGIPYTILAVGLFLWSIKKPAPLIYKVFFFSPFLLSILAIPELALVAFWPPQALSTKSLVDFLSYVLITVIPMLVIGYVFVGLGSLLYKIIGHNVRWSALFWGIFPSKPIEDNQWITKWLEEARK